MDDFDGKKETAHNSSTCTFLIIQKSLPDAV
jgi:hypothetical protein